MDTNKIKWVDPDKKLQPYNLTNYKPPAGVDPLLWAIFGSWCHWEELSQYKNIACELIGYHSFYAGYCPLCAFFNPDNIPLGVEGVEDDIDNHPCTKCVLDCHKPGSLWGAFVEAPTQKNAETFRDEIASSALEYFEDNGGERNEAKA